MAKRRLKIDLGELILGFNTRSDEAQYYLNTMTGDVFPVIDEAITGIPNPEVTGDCISVPSIPSYQGYSDMEAFIETVENQRLRGQLEVAIQGRGAFRRFKDVLLNFPEDRQKWFAFKDQQMRERVLDWLDENDIEPIE